MKHLEIFPAYSVTQTLIPHKLLAQYNVCSRFFKLTEFWLENMSLPLHKRYEIVFLRVHTHGPKLGFPAIAKIVGCAKSTVIYWVHKWKKTKDLSDDQRVGPRRVTTTRQDKQIVQLAVKDVNATSSKIQYKMEGKGVDISARTVRRRLREAEGKYTKPMLKPLLSTRHQRQRLSWAKQHRNFDWNKVIFTDESTFYLNQPVGKTWNFPGKKKVIRTVKHPVKVNAWACFSASGFGEIICFERNLDAKFMCTIYEKGLLPSVQKLFGEDNLDWVLQEDNDPKHRSKLAQEWKVRNEITQLPWPSMSPDQNPIENVWRVMKINIGKKNIRTAEHLRRELKTEWGRLPSGLAENLVKSMERRVTSLIEVKGDYTLY